MKEDDTRPAGAAIGRRDAMKLGAGAVVTALTPEQSQCLIAALEQLVIAASEQLLQEDAVTA